MRSLWYGFEYRSVDTVCSDLMVVLDPSAHWSVWHLKKVCKLLFGKIILQFVSALG